MNGLQSGQDGSNETFGVLFNQFDPIHIQPIVHLWMIKIGLVDQKI